MPSSDRVSNGPKCGSTSGLQSNFLLLTDGSQPPESVSITPQDKTVHHNQLSKIQNNNPPLVHDVIIHSEIPGKYCWPGLHHCSFTPTTPPSIFLVHLMLLLKTSFLSFYSRMSKIVTFSLSPHAALAMSFQLTYLVILTSILQSHAISVTSTRLLNWLFPPHVRNLQLVHQLHVQLISSFQQLLAFSITTTGPPVTHSAIVASLSHLKIFR